ncbi:MAG: hypothetical protein LCH92_11180 [Proteobacteria bacterium]|nr:hypothetical protein [Pseudomonadota bacterium]
MFDDELPEFAVRGEAGIDLFERLPMDGQRRSRFRCLATLTGDGTLIDHSGKAQPQAARLIALAEGIAADPVLAPMSLGDASAWPRAAAGGDPLRLFLYLDFFRAWQVADLAGARLEAQLARESGALPVDPGQLAGAIGPVFDFNRLTRGRALARALVPRLRPLLAQPGGEGRHEGIGFALRMLGDLCLRAGAPAEALTCFDTAVAAGDNPFRRRKAIEAARAAGDAEALARHRAGYAVRWKLPADLAETGDSE